MSATNYGALHDLLVFVLLEIDPQHAGKAGFKLAKLHSANQGLAGLRIGGIGR
jgi:hypothetical protein